MRLARQKYIHRSLFLEEKSKRHPKRKGSIMVMVEKHYRKQRINRANLAADEPLIGGVDFHHQHQFGFRPPSWYSDSFAHSESAYHSTPESERIQLARSIPLYDSMNSTCHNFRVDEPRDFRWSFKVGVLGISDEVAWKFPKKAPQTQILLALFNNCMSILLIGFLT